MPMVRTVAEDAGEQKVLDHIAKFGWHCVNILAEGHEGAYSFTVGLFHTYQHPELIIYGLKSEVAHKVLSNAVEGLPHGKRVDLNAATDELLVGYSCCFVEVPSSKYYEYVGWESACVPRPCGVRHRLHIPRTCSSPYRFLPPLPLRLAIR
jgi:uncharacterized protein DUF4262